jgi:glycerophosphoryl diester phosphodiesterase
LIGQTVGKEPLAVATLARAVWHDFRRAWGALVVFEAVFKLLEAWLFVPAAAVVLSAILARAGHVAVSNRDIVDFLLSPAGLLSAALSGTVAVAFLLFEPAGIMVLAARAGPVERPPLRQTLIAAFLKPLRIVKLGAVKLALLALTFAPFVLLAALTYAIFLSRHDINHYLKDRPPTFWLAAAIGVLLMLAALAAGLFLYVRWAFALPVLLFEGQPARAALRASRERVRGAGWRVGFLVLGWQLAGLLLGWALFAGFRLLAAAILDNAGERPITPILVLLASQAGLLAAVSFVRVVGLGLLTRRLYLLRSEQLGLLPRDAGEAATDTKKPALPWAQRLALLAVPVVLLAPLAPWAEMSRSLAAAPPVRVTAHRGHSRAAPENTLSAVRKAIESGADYAEVDVQLTADGVVVLLHDRDLKRVAGVPRRLDELTYDEVRRLDVGSWFDPAFAGERVPTLAEVIDLARGRIRLNIELKSIGPVRRLAGEVARLVRAQHFESECLVTSFDLGDLREVKRQNPGQRTGLIVAYALGDVSRLDVEALSVRADWLSDDVLRAAHGRGMEVHVWTLKDAGRMARFIKRGVDNLITSDPDLAIRVRDEWASLTGPERLVLASRLLLGLDPDAGKAGERALPSTPDQPGAPATGEEDPSLALRAGSRPTLSSPLRGGEPPGSRPRPRGGRS